MKRFALIAPVLSIGLVLTACDERTPTDPAYSSPRPSFDLESSGGSTSAVGYEVQEVNITHGSDFMCVGVFTGTFDNVVAPPGAFCYLLNATVRGNVKALQDAVLTLDVNTTVAGSVYGDKADVLQMRNNVTVHGNIEMVEGGPHPIFREVAICGTHLPNGGIKIIKMTAGLSFFNGIDISPDAFCAIPSPNSALKGSLQVEDNIIPATAFLSITSNMVAQNLQVYKTSGSGSKAVVANFVGESVQCFDNQPPFLGAPNTAPKVEGQCF